MTFSANRIRWVSLAFPLLLSASILAGCTGATGQDVSPSDEQVSEASSTPLLEADPEQTIAPLPAQEPGESSPPPSEQESEEEESQPAEPVPPPLGGNVTEEAPSVEIPTPIETELTAEVSPSENITVEVAGIEEIETSSTAPGQVAGPALAVMVRIKNNGEGPLDVSGVEVALEGNDGSPGSGMIDELADWFAGTIEGGTEGSGTYVFTVAESQRDSIRVSVSVRPGLPAAVFVGRP